MNQKVHYFEWRGIKLQLRYTANYSPAYHKIYGHPMTHNELHVVEPERARLPITETGFYSLFLPLPEREGFNNPVDYMCALLDDAATSKEWLAHEKAFAQHTLF